ncbi:hypothetical protein AYJ57_25330 (plasmid) [Salipiger sp. CCB-MM3]|nr:hypothetical protein AYJ57_25330 [Salipiger sp. CCB-MM3]
MVTWTSIGQDGNGAGIFAQVFGTNSVSTGDVLISGTPTQAETLTASNTLADVDGLGSLSYQWQRGGVDITGATGTTYTLTQDDVGTQITVTISYTDGQGTAESATSAATSAVQNVNDAPTGSVIISGTPTQAETLTASNTLADVDGLGALSYQWQRGGVDITGATGTTYTLAQDDVGEQITLTASYTDGQGTAESATSAATSAVQNINDTPTGSVIISGSPTENETLTASNTLADVDGLGSLSYQWQRGGVDITGATGATYTLTQDDVGTQITLTASYTDGQGTAESATSAATSAVQNVNDAPTGSVIISGTPTQAETLTASNTLADVDGLGALSYQWQRGGVDITGATGTTYTLTQDDVGEQITLTASYTDGQGTAESATSAATSAVQNINDTPTGSVIISGSPTENETLTASNTLADVDGLGSLSYQWQRGGVDITGATGATYTLTQDDVGTQITLTASYTDGQGTAESATSATTSVVQNINDAPTGSVIISGTPTQAETLTASNTLADVDGLGALSYQWQRGGVDITGATGATYTLTQDDVGEQITLTVSYTDGQGTAESATSAATSAVQNINDTPTGSVIISGSPTENETLTASNTLADVDGLGSLSYQWQRGGVDITGATGTTYTLTQDDVGAPITVTVSYADGQGTAESVTSLPTLPIRYGDQIVVADDDDSTLRGYYGEDLLIGGIGNDTLNAGFNDDTLRGGEGDDTLRGSQGNDILRGGEGDDLLYGGKGSDVLQGLGDDDELRGRLGADSLYGGRGADLLIGGKGDDELTGRAGADIFRFGGNAGSDVIADFGRGADLIEITSGARHLGQLDFVQTGNNVIISFTDTTIEVENTTTDFMQTVDHFLFT